MKVSWTDISADSSQIDAFQEIVNQSHSFDIAASDYLGLGHLMVSMAMNTMDYADPMDHARTLEHDAARHRQIRYANFVDYTCDFTDRRLALIQEGDGYLQRKMDIFSARKKDMRVLQSFSEASAVRQGDLETTASAFEFLRDQLLGGGMSRKSLSKAFLDAGFVFARQRPLDEYISFCHHVTATLDPERAKLRPLTQELVYDTGRMEGRMLSDRAFLHLEAASASIH